MFEHIVQGIAYAGGVEVAPGKTIMPQRVVNNRKPGLIRRVAGRALARVERQLGDWSSRLLAPAPDCQSHF